MYLISMYLCIVSAHFDTKIMYVGQLEVIILQKNMIFCSICKGRHKNVRRRRNFFFWGGYFFIFVFLKPIRNFSET